MPNPAITETNSQCRLEVNRARRGNDERCLIRQPILDSRGNVFAYELLIQEDVSEAQASTPEPAAHPILDTLSLFGLEHFTGGSPAFLRCTAREIIDGLVLDLPAASIVLEIGKDDDPSSRLVQSCRKLKESGFRLAFRDFSTNEIPRFPVQLLDFVKVNSDCLETPEWVRLCRMLQGAPATIVADRVHTHDACRKARAAGIRYFHGFYFCTPELIRKGRIPANSFYHVEILKELFKDPLDLKALCPLVMRDASLVYRVLRFANSPLCAIRRPVISLDSAMMILGDDAFRRIATLAIECALNQNQSPEIVNMALVRARFCATAAPRCELNPNEQYLLGMLSLLPVMLQTPMETIVPELPLRAAICQALRGETVKERCLLSSIELLERNQVSSCEALAQSYGLNQRELNEIYMNALDTSDRSSLAS
jgi:EAL and modified HD-GYP domain-containing signal transduction protein